MITLQSSPKSEIKVESKSSLVQRVTSIDILRALTMVLMIFVNDLWSLKKHSGLAWARRTWRRWYRPG